MATVKTPSIEEIYQAILDDYQARTSQEVPLVRRAVIKFIAWGLSGVVSLLWKYGSWQYLQVFVETAELEALKKWGSLRGIDYNEGTTATLNITLSNVTASVILAGTIWRSSDNGLTYISQNNTAVVEGVAVVSVVASDEGTQGNLPIGAILNITNPLTGIPETSEVTSVTQTGEEPEDIEVYRTRVAFAYRRPPQGGSASDYYLWTTSVEGINDCLVYVFDAGKVTLYPIASGSGLERTATGAITINPFPEFIDGIETAQTGTGQKLAIYNAIQSDGGTIQNRRPIQVPVEILDPTYIELEVVITGLTPNNADIRAGIKQSLITYLDTKKPQIPALDYTQTLARINQTKLASIVQETIESFGGGSFTTLTLNKDGTEIDQYTLGYGELSVLDRLEINGAEV